MIVAYSIICYKIYMPHLPMPVTARSLDTVLRLHGLEAEMFEGATVYDLGCGLSNLAGGLALRGVQADVFGFDNHPRVLADHDRLLQGTSVIEAALDTLPVADSSADIVLATYSLPMWASDGDQIERFYTECQRVVKVDGILSIYPIATQTKIDGESVNEEFYRMFAATQGANDIRNSDAWIPVNVTDTELLSVRKLDTSY
jgi:ubiquinone/menaquinone biosynthesis C-methylase UbiE